MADVDSVIKVRADTREFHQGMGRVQDDLKKTGKQARDLGRSMRLMRGGMGQIGHQIQDIAVQAQMGTSAFVILGQQGGQIAALFGPGGALFGAFLAIAAGIAGPLVKSLTESSDLLEELKEKALGTTLSLDKLDGIQRKLAESVLLKRQADVMTALGEANDGLREALADQEKVANKTARQLARHGGSAEDAAEQVAEFEEAVALAEAELVELDLALNPAKAAMQEYEASLRETNATLQEQIDTFGMNEVQIARFKAEQDGFISTVEETNIALTEELFLLKEKAKADEAARLEIEQLAEAERKALEVITREQDKRFKEAKKKREKDLQDQQKAKDLAISGVRDQLFALDAENKKVFQMQKGYRMAEATISAFQAANNALAAPFPFPIPQAMAAAALTLGLANVAQIKAQSFEGGGFTGMGARAGGLDGKGGRMALVHPDETIVDHRAGGGSGITVINNVDASGAGADVDQKIKTAMAQTSQQTIMTIQDLMRRRRFA